MAPNPPAIRKAHSKTNAIANKPPLVKCSIAPTNCSTHDTAVSFANSAAHPHTYSSPNSFSDYTADQRPVDVHTNAPADTSSQPRAYQ